MINITTSELLQKVKEEKVKFISLQFSDINGILKHVIITSERLTTALEEGIWFDGSSIEGFVRIFESDLYLKPDINTFAILPWIAEENKTARLICDIYQPDGTPFAGDPRYILKRALKEAEELGYSYNVGPEIEFFLFDRVDNLLQPNTHDNASYFDLQGDMAILVKQEMTKALESMGIKVEAGHHEVAPGQHEIDFSYAPALETADNAVTFKLAVQAIANKYNLHATFMPKPITGINGSGMHTHQSLFDRENKHNLFFNSKDPYFLSAIARNFVAGQLHFAREICIILSPTVNSYKRLVLGYEAPVYISWAQINRSALIRIPKCSPKNINGIRIELRSPDPSCNPYLAFAVMLKAGLEGIKRNLTPPQPIEENIYELQGNAKYPKLSTLPESLKEALEEVKKSTLVKETLGEHCYNYFIKAKTAEWEAYKIQVTPWELKHYLGTY